MSKTQSKVAGLIGSEAVQKLSKAGVVCLTELEYAALQQQALDHRARRLERELHVERQAGADASVFASVIYPYLEKWVDRREEYRELPAGYKDEMGRRLSEAECTLVTTFNACRRYQNEQINLRYASPRITPLQRLMPHLQGWLDAIGKPDTWTTRRTAHEMALYTVVVEVLREYGAR